MKRFIALILAVFMIAVFPVTLNSASYKLGDINIDGAINAKDYAYAYRNGFNDSELFDYGKINANYNRIIYDEN